MKVTLVDYGMGNLFSVRHALEYCGAEVKMASSFREAEGSERMVLPGVGAFSDGMVALRSQGLDDAVLEHSKSGRPLLGICLGMQLPFSYSEEFGHWPGLGLVEGTVVEIPRVSSAGVKLKVPHIGWSEIQADPNVEGKMFRGLGTNRSFYFVHSFHAVFHDPDLPKAWTDYGGVPLTAGFVKDSIWGCQFHPEKSGPNGLQVLKNFMSI